MAVKHVVLSETVELATMNDLIEFIRETMIGADEATTEADWNTEELDNLCGVLAAALIGSGWISHLRIDPAPAQPAP